MTPPRYPFQALADALQIELHRGGRADGADGYDGLAVIATRLGISHRHARRCLANGLTDRQADRFAVRLGRHPASVWPSWWEHVDGDGEWFGDDPALECLRPALALVGTGAS